MLNIRIRPAIAEDYLFLKIFLYKSIFQPPGEEPFPFSIIERPEISKYISGWPKESDIGFMVEKEGEIIGAIWVRFFSQSDKGYGYISSDIPELGMALMEDFRGTGIGTEMLNQMFRELTRQNIRKVSLSVDKRNKAFHLYQKAGFKIVKETENSAIMLKLI